MDVHLLARIRLESGAAQAPSRDVPVAAGAAIVHRILAEVLR